MKRVWRTKVALCLGAVGMCTRSSNAAGFQAAALDTLVLKAERLRLGVLQGDTALEFGSVRAVAVDASGHIFVSDSRRSRIGMFSSNGKLIQFIGRRGRGPAEFIDPRALSVRGETLSVFDGITQRITQYRIGKKGVTLSGSTPVPFVAEDFCELGTRLVFLANKGGRIIQVLDPDGREVASFGSTIGPDVPITRGGITRGKVACIQAANLIIVLPNLSGEVFAYRDNGRVAWHTEIPGFQPINLQLYDKGKGARLTMPPDGVAHEGWSVCQVGTDAILVQVLRVKYARGTKRIESRRVESLIIDANTGRIRGRQGDLQTAKATAGSHLYWAREDPFPQLVVQPYTLSRTR